MRRAKTEGGTLVNKGIQHAGRRHISDRREIERYQKNQEKSDVAVLNLASTKQ